MIQGFLKQSGGTVRVYSEVGEGTTFKLYFPARSKPSPAVTAEEKTHADVPAEGTRVLVAEDEEPVRKVICEVLRGIGYTVVDAGSGDEALSLFHEAENIDVLLTDIVMPGEVQGPALAKRLREIRPELPVVFMSGYPAEATVHGNGLRPDDIRLMKPVSRQDLVEALYKARHQSGQD